MKIPFHADQLSHQELENILYFRRLHAEIADENTIECPWCHGSGELLDTCNGCESGKIDCERCDGTGVEPDADGDPLKFGPVCASCKGKCVEQCPQCDGQGFTIEDECEHCQAEGRLPVRKSP